MKFNKSAITANVLSFFLLYAVASSVYGQESNFGPCSLPTDWSKIRIVKDVSPETGGKFLIVTNRVYQPDAPNGILFPNKMSEYRKVSYLLADCKDGNWLLYPLDKLEAGLVAIDDGRNMLLFVHGHGKSLDRVLTRSKQISDKYDVSLVVFDWPSFNSNFNKSLSRVRRCGENFYNLLLNLKQYRKENMKEDQRLSLLMHSLGNYFITHMVVNGNNQYMKEKIFDNIIMNAAAVRAKEHGEVISQLDIQDRIYIVYNNRDKVLRGAHLLTSGKMLGNLAMKPYASNSSYLDFSRVAGTEHTYFAGYHDFEYENPAFSYFFQGAFQGENVDLDNSPLFTPENDRNVYMVKGSQ